MGVKKIGYDKREDLINLFESFNFQPYGAYGNSLRPTRIKRMIRDEEWWFNKTIYATLIDGVIDAVDIVANDTEVFPWTVSNQFVRYTGKPREKHPGSDFDEGLWRTLNFSFTQEYKAGRHMRLSLECSALNMRTQPLYWDCLDSWAPGHYTRSVMKVFPFNVVSQWIGKDNLFCKHFIDQRSKHKFPIERTAFLYYKTTDIIA